MGRADKDISGKDKSGSAFSHAFREAGPYLTLGLELGLTMIAWSVIGYLVDRWLDTLPWLTLAGVAIGMVSVFLQIVRAAKTSDKSDGKSGRGA